MKEEIFYGTELENATGSQLIKAIHEYILYYNYDRIVVKLLGKIIGGSSKLLNFSTILS